MALILVPALLTACGSSGKLEKAFALSESSMTLMVGDTKTLTVNLAKDTDVGDYTVAWASEDSTVAIVKENGAVTALAEGTTNIVATVTAEKGNVTLKVTVAVVKNTTPLTDISFNATIYSLGAGQTLNLLGELEYTPVNAANKELIWTSSNPSIATVSDGIVFPVSQGVSTITAKTPDGTISAACTVRVSEIAVEATGITFEQAGYTVAVGTSTKIEAKIEPENATGYSITWESEDPTIATVTAGKVTGVSEGMTTVTAILNGKSNLKATCTVFVDDGGTVIILATKVRISPSAKTISKDEDGPFKFNLILEPANCTEKPSWSTNRPDLLDMDPVTGEFYVASAPSDTTASVIVTCVVGKCQATAVVHIEPRKQELKIVVDEESLLYDSAPLNTMELVAALTNSSELPEVTWTSSDPFVASVDAMGIVTGHKAGTCTITAVSTENPEMTDSYTLTVHKADFITLTVGATMTVDPELIPLDDVTWVASPMYLEYNVEDRTITGLKETTSSPAVLTVYSAATGEPYTIDVFILPEE